MISHIKINVYKYHNTKSYLTVQQVGSQIWSSACGTLVKENGQTGLNNGTYFHEQECVSTCQNLQAGRLQKDNTILSSSPGSQENESETIVGTDLPKLDSWRLAWSPSKFQLFFFVKTLDGDLKPFMSLCSVKANLVSLVASALYWIAVWHTWNETIHCRPLVTVTSSTGCPLYTNQHQSSLLHFSTTTVISRLK